MTRLKCPCYGCLRRETGCHVTCKDYIAWRANEDARAETIRKAKLKDQYYF